MNARVQKPAAAFSTQIVTWRDAQETLSRIRDEVFVREQGVPPEMEPDRHDAAATHIIARNANGEAVGVARITSAGKIGRMAVLREWRGRGVGAMLLRALINEARRRNLKQVTLNAQTDARAFYAKFGFIARGETFIEAGIAHIAMQLEIQ